MAAAAHIRHAFERAFFVASAARLLRVTLASYAMPLHAQICLRAFAAQRQEQARMRSVSERAQAYAEAREALIARCAARACAHGCYAFRHASRSPIINNDTTLRYALHCSSFRLPHARHT